MDLLADENQHSVVVARLRAAGYNVEWIRESSPGAQDEDILSRSDIAQFILTTDDRDFGDLIFNRGYPQPCAILYSRLDRKYPDLIADRLLALLADGVATGHLTAITKDGQRLKPFPLGVDNA